MNVAALSLNISLSRMHFTEKYRVKLQKESQQRNAKRKENNKTIVWKAMTEKRDYKRNVSIK